MEEEQRRALAGLLEKRATFSQGLKELGLAIQSCSPNNTVRLDSFLALLPRTLTLLKARYSNPTYWKAAHELYRICESAAASRPEQLPRVKQLRAEAEAFLAEHDVELPSAPAAAPAAASFLPARPPGAPLTLEDVLMAEQHAVLGMAAGQVRMLRQGCGVVRQALTGSAGGVGPLSGAKKTLPELA